MLTLQGKGGCVSSVREAVVKTQGYYRKLWTVRHNFTIDNVITAAVNQR
jgi:hypothetical protein